MNNEYKIFLKYANVAKWRRNVPIKGWNTGKPLMLIEATSMVEALSIASNKSGSGSGLLGAVKVQQ